jgi:hypothetical protein
MLTRWQGAGVLLAVGIVYTAVLAAVLHRWVLTDEEKQQGYGLLERSLHVFRGREATA